MRNVRKSFGKMPRSSQKMSFLSLSDFRYLWRFLHVPLMKNGSRLGMLFWMKLFSFRYLLP